jgi:catechol 2,3-dioxygenase-like lactoylglutathione lyase family enzyme
MIEVKDIVPTFFVPDLRKSVEWYREVMGFTMREATLRDPDGNDLYVGQPI